MITIRSLPGNPKAEHTYRVAGQPLLSDTPIPALTPFATPLPHLVTLPPCHLVTLPPCHLVTYTGPAWLGSAWRQLTCQRDRDAFWLTIDGIGHLTISIAGDAIQQQATDAATAAQRAEALLGPALTLALALRGVFCLHASAVLVEDQLLLFLGPSGSGKSTLAAYLDQTSAWRRAADDIIPLRCAESGLLALPHFPQLKLDGPEQPALNLPETIPVRAIYTLDEPASEKTARIRPLDRPASVLRLIRHTVTARLFDQNLLAAHMAFCAAAARRQPVHQLLYPRRLEHLPSIQPLLSADIAIAR